MLLKHLNALLYPDQGEVVIDGHMLFELSYTDLRKIRQKFGILFQGGALFDSINTFENVAFPLRYFTDLNELEIRKKVEKALEMVNLVGSGDKPTSALSGGMRKRVGLARAIILEPEYVLYDEPTSGLDPQTSQEINDLIIYMSEHLEITSIVITHDMYSVLQIAEKVVFLDQNKLSWYGTLEEMRSSTDSSLLDFIKASEYQI